MATKTKKKPNKKLQKKVSQKSRRIFILDFVKKHRIFTVLLAALLALVFFGLITWMQNERADTIEARNLTTELDAVDVKMQPEFDAIVAGIGVKPDTTKHAKECTYANTDGDPGRPNCGPAFMASYHDTMTRTEADKIFDSTVSSIVATLGLDISSDNFQKPADPADPFKVFYASVDLSIETRCVLEVSKDANYSNDKSSNIFVDFEYRCKAVSPLPIYPIFDYNNQ